MDHRRRNYAEGPLGIVMNQGGAAEMSGQSVLRHAEVLKSVVTEVRNETRIQIKRYQRGAQANPRQHFELKLIFSSDAFRAANLSGNRSA